MRLFSRLAIEQDSLAIKAANMTARSISTILSAVTMADFKGA